MALPFRCARAWPGPCRPAAPDVGAAATPGPRVESRNSRDPVAAAPYRAGDREVARYAFGPHPTSDCLVFPNIFGTCGPTGPAAGSHLQQHQRDAQRPTSAIAAVARSLACASAVCRLTPRQAAASVPRGGIAAASSRWAGIAALHGCPQHLPSCA